MSVIKAKHFCVDQLTFERPQPIIGRSYVIGVRYDDVHLMVQMPRCVVSRDLYEIDGKHYIDVLVSQSSALFNFIRDMNAKVCQHVGTLQEYNLHDHILSDHITKMSRTADEIFYSIRIKIPKKGSQFQTKFTSEGRGPTCVADVKVGSTLLIVVHIDNVYCVNGFVGYHMLMKEARLVNG